jgi:radical SAM superfamily enzyme YgiQ (UPF0313 family)
MITSRGCPHKCKFCVSGHLRDGKYHRRSFDNVIAEIAELRSSHCVGTIVFYDDAFFPDPEGLGQDVNELAKGMEKVNGQLIWQIEMRPDILIALSKDMAKTLFAAGCRQFNIGIEKAESANSGFICKQVDTERIREATRHICMETPGIRLAGTFILGGPGENRESVLQTIALAKQLNLLFAHFYPLEVYPGTDIYKDYFTDDGQLDWHARILTDDLPWGELVYESPLLTRKDLLELVVEAYRSFYKREEWHTTARRVLGSNYFNVVDVVEGWCTDRFALAREAK